MPPGAARGNLPRLPLPPQPFTFSGSPFCRGDALTKKREGAGIDRKLHDPVKDKLSPVFPLDLSRAKTISALVRGMADTAFTGPQPGEAVDVLEARARDHNWFVVMTLPAPITLPNPRRRTSA